MKSADKNNLFFLTFLSFSTLATWETGLFTPSQIATAQITPDTDGTNTQITPSGNQFNIQGGQQSSDGTNLFHSFQQFGLTQGQTANFISNSNIRNILGRVVGGDASIINGLIQVTGGNANLFLMNPAGIVFGANSSLNVPGSFTATTATGIGFGNNWFSAVGTNDYTKLVGNPNTFAFTNQQPGGIINLGTLAVKQGQSLSLLGGTILSTGQLSAPGGNITIAAVPGQNLVRISQPGNLLSLEIQPQSLAGSSPQNWVLPVASLPQLLMGGEGSATGVTVNSQGQVVLTGSGLQVKNGDVVSGAYTGASLKVDTTSGTGNIIFTGDINITSPDATLASATTGDEFILGSSRSLILRSGGNIRVAQIQTFPDTKFFSLSGKTGPVILQAAGNIKTERIDVSNFNGDASSISLTAGGDISTGELRGIVSSVNGKGADISVNAGGTLTVTGYIGAFSPSGAGDITFKAKGDISINCPNASVCIESFAGGVAGLTPTGNGGNVSIISEQGSIISLRDPINIGTDTSASLSNPGTLNLQARGDITVGRISAFSYQNSKSDGANITITSANGKIEFGDINNSSDNGKGGNITISTSGNIRTGDVLNYGKLQGGSVNFTTTNGSITTGKLNATSSQDSGNDTIFNPENGGSITLNADRDITTGNLSVMANQNGGPIALTSGGLINTGAIDTTGDLAAGKIALQATTGIKTSTAGTTITGLSAKGNGSNVTLSTVSGNINVGDLLVSGKLQGGSIGVTNTNGDITTGKLITSYDGSDKNLTTNKGGTVTLNAKGNITTSAIQAIGVQEGAAISLKSGGFINTTGGIINAIGGNSGGNISLEASSNITTAGIGALLLSGFNANSGNLRIQSGGNIDTTAGSLITAAGSGKGGNIAIDAKGTVATSSINSRTFAPSTTVTGGNIDVKANSITVGGTIETNRNNITFAAPVTLSNDLSVRIMETGDITFGSTVDGSHNLTVQPKDGVVQFGGAIGNVTRLNSINIQDDIPKSTAAIDIATTNNITTQNIISDAGIYLYSEKGEITTKNLQGTAGIYLYSEKGEIKTENLNSTSPNNGGNIDLNAGTNITAGDINSSADGNAGNILLDANGNINAGKIDSSAGGNAGDVRAINRSSAGNIVVSQINAESRGTGTGGNVGILTENFFRSPNSFIDRNGINASISTAGSLGDASGGTIIIRHGGAGITPFRRC
ncbi:MAG: filamentous hemagglutinin N-terminal domain-containing protein [Microcoleus sp. PH2017_39_LGB_O_B]|uniref:two-partner secretion domain-containing protein n=1 Tax=unclassified Microcoleus TaxID=2642155 RepID=UPI001D4AACA8|nr:MULTISPECIES: filamentous hemagglutinin N-terminal domain-containing protein [unclassified Microcoleus]MCC3451836.1 filamentous hemagglutinin N-terminal domain-containing protein [Microcoleus sp. PH2017_09_SFU_O_A]MCC3632752.1 filamentous hemagglutinin N-terminal domain-containing protein [Microcoleus sp. PH2017_39_LGB_O_B]MCC3644986.1 filamentous hemagglutinin N-terminal domain-containing protein [Microcoleus sp. PH2017_33_LGB_O_A]TAF89014.1 MAG: filamentous hemagglutinin N-terminal domain-